jgi:hypothetical protein
MVSRNSRNHPCTLVLWSSKSVYRTLLTNVVDSAAFGDFVHFDKPDSGGSNSPQYLFSGPAKLSRTQNTTISAIVIPSAFRLDYLWIAASRELAAKEKRGEELLFSDQFEILQRLAPEIEPRYSYEGTIRAIAIENPNARISLPFSLFTGPFDQRWSTRAGTPQVASIGSELQRLQADGVPFVLL